MSFFLYNFLFLLIYFCHSGAQAEVYDLIVIGGGVAGEVVALTASNYSKKILIVEAAKFGGAYQNTIVFPSKTLYFISKKNEMATLFLKNYCVSPKSKPKIDLQKVVESVQIASSKIHNMYGPEYLRYKDIKIRYGNAEFIDPYTIKVNKEIIRAKSFVIATGATPIIPDIKNIDAINYLSGDNIFVQKNIPQSIIVVGGGAEAVETASIYSGLGSRVTIICKYGKLLRNFDSEVVQVLNKSLLKRKISIQCDMEVESVEYDMDGQVLVHCCSNIQKKYTFSSEKLILCTGYRGNTNSCGLKKIGVRVDEKGIMVNRKMQTNIPHIYACGDVVNIIGSNVRAANLQGIVAAHNALFYNKTAQLVPKNWHIPKCVFSTPPIVSVGLTESEAFKRYGEKIVIFRYPFDYSPLAIIKDRCYGMLKMIYDPEGITRGIHIFGEGSVEMLAELSVGKRFDEQLKEYQHKVYVSPHTLDLFWAVLFDYVQRFPPSVNEKLSWFGKIKGVIFSIFSKRAR